MEFINENYINSLLENYELFSEDYQSDIIIPSNATKIHYIISAADNSNNWKTVSNNSFEIIDNDAPIIIDHSLKKLTTGENYTFNFTINDNINISKVNLEY